MFESTARLVPPQAKPLPVGPCVRCGRTMKLPARGLCCSCYQKEPRVRCGRFEAATDPARLARAKANEAHFVEDLLPAVRRYAWRCLRRLRNPTRRFELLDECIAYSWVVFVRDSNLTSVGLFAKRVVNPVLFRDRQVCGRERLTEPLGRRCRRRVGFCVRPDYECVLYDNQTLAEPTARAAAFAVDFRRWLARRPLQIRRVIRRLISGYTPREIAERLGLSVVEVRQIRHNLLQSWVDEHAG